TLGVSRDIISEDYLLTNQFYKRDPNHSTDLPDEIRQVLGSVQASFLAAAFEVIDADYGDLETYIRDGLGIGKAERARLEARYLQA
ncbi:MAG: tyrosine-protein phosphatase, partial [Bradyrhizobium sp.]